MNNRELDDLLKRSKPPGREERFWREFPARVAAEARRDPARPDFLHSAQGGYGWERLLFGQPLKAGVALAVLVVLFGFLLGRWPSSSFQASERQLAAAATYYREITALFPGQVKAIEFDSSGVRMVLEDRPGKLLGVPVYIQVREDGRTREYVLFSGQQVTVSGQTCEVLDDGRGGVLVVGPAFAWSSASPSAQPRGARIHAQLLGGIS